MGRIIVRYPSPMVLKFTIALGNQHQYIYDALLHNSVIRQ
jgi:hypothetical protein